MLGANTGMARVNDFGLSGNKPIKHINLFVINFTDVLRTEKTLFLIHGLEW